MDSTSLLLCTFLCLGSLPGAYLDDLTDKCPALEEDGLHPEPPRPGMRYLAQKPGEDLAGVPKDVIESRNQFLITRTFPTEPRPDECNNCFPYIYRTVIGVKGCDDKPQIKVLIIVTTVPSEAQQRQAVRETWGKETDHTKTVFLFGVGWGRNEQKILDKESQQYGDILQENYIDSYFNLTIKVLSGFHWWSRKCAHAPYVLRTAADNFINIPNLLKLTESNPKLMGGTCGVTKVNRNVRSKFHVSTFEYPKNKLDYPIFCLGTAYLPPAKLTKLIIEKSPNVPYFPLEDAYFGLLLVYIQQPPVHIRGFNAKYKRQGSECEVPSNWISLHPIPTALEMRWIGENCNL